MHHKLIDNHNAINIVIKNDVGKAYSHHKKQTTKNKKFESSSSIPNIVVPTYSNRFVDIPYPKISQNYDLNEPRIRSEAPISTSAGSASFHTIGDPTPRDVYEPSNPVELGIEELGIEEPPRRKIIRSGGGVSKPYDGNEADDEEEENIPDENGYFSIDTEKSVKKKRRTQTEMKIYRQHEQLVKREKAIEKTHNKILSLKNKIDDANKKYMKYVDKPDSNRWKQTSHSNLIKLQRDLQDAEEHLLVLQNEEK